MNRLIHWTNLVKIKHKDTDHFPKFILGTGILGVALTSYFIIFNSSLIEITHTSLGPYPVMLSSTIFVRDIMFIHIILLIGLMQIFYSLYLMKRTKNGKGVFSLKFIRLSKWLCILLLWLSLYLSGILVHNPGQLISIMHNPFRLVILESIRPFATFNMIFLGGKITLSFLWFNSVILGWQLFWREDAFHFRKDNFPSRGYFLIILLISILISTVIHEFGHFLLVIISGGEILAFRVIPSIIGGKFYFGFVQFCCVTASARPWIMIGPIFTQFAYASIVLSLLLFSGKKVNLGNGKTIPPMVRGKDLIQLFLQISLLCALVDGPIYALNNSLGLPHWFVTGEPDGDYLIFAEILNIPLKWIGIFGFIALTVSLLVYFYFFHTPKNVRKGKNKGAL